MTELQELESELKGLTPSRLQPELEKDLEEIVRRPRPRHGLWVTGSAVAAAALVMALLPPLGQAPMEPVFPESSVPRADVPIRTVSDWERTWDDGIMRDVNGVQARRVTHQRLKTVLIRDPVRNIVIELVVPEETVTYHGLEVH